jgi:hypothetical protein
MKLIYVWSVSTTAVALKTMKNKKSSRSFVSAGLEGEGPFRRAS